MNLFKSLPLSFLGELHHIQLVNFSVDQEEVAALLPDPLQIADFHGRALISMVNVQLKQMRPTFLPAHLSFQYQHIGFRLLVKDQAYHGGGQDQGIYFLDSFTSRRLMAWGGSLLTDYRLHKAEIQHQPTAVTLRRGAQLLQYKVEETHLPDTDHSALLTSVGAIDRAYSKLGPTLRVTQIVREKWPLVPLAVTDFKTNFFRTARLEGAFRVDEVIHYQWLPPRVVVRQPQQHLPQQQQLESAVPQKEIRV